MKNNKLTIPEAIIIGAIVLGIALMFVQGNKSKSMERQQSDKLKQEMQLVELKENKDICSDMLKGLQSQFGNVVGINYSTLWEECEVTYLDNDTGEMETSPLSWTWKATE